MFGSSDPPDALPFLFAPNWSSLDVGARVSAVVNDVCWDPHVGIGLLVPGDKSIRLSGLIPPEACQCSKVTVLKGLVPGLFISCGLGSG